MNKLSILNFVLIGLLTGCSLQMEKSQGTKSKIDPDGGETRISLSGAEGTRVEGFYVQRGERFEISGVVPWNLISTGISYVEIRKATAADTIVANLQYDDRQRTHVRRTMTLGPEVRRVKVQVQNGFATKTFSR